MDTIVIDAGAKLKTGSPCAYVLTSTGLIESESWPRLNMTQRFKPVKYAWVERITDEGFAEIASLELQAIQRTETTPEAARKESADPTGMPQPLRPATREIKRVPRTTWIVECA